MEIEIDAGFGKAVIAADRVLEIGQEIGAQPVSADALGQAVETGLDILGQRFQRIAGNDIAGQVRAGGRDQIAAEFAGAVIEQEDLVEIGIIAGPLVVIMVGPGAFG